MYRYVARALEYFKKQLSDFCLHYLFSECEISFDPTTYSVIEGSTATLTVVKECVAEIPVSVTVNTMDGTAVGMQSYCC